MSGAILSPLPDSPERDARHARDAEITARHDALISAAAAAHRAGQPYEEMLDAAVALADSVCRSESNARIVRRLFDLELAGRRSIRPMTISPSPIR